MTLPTWTPEMTAELRRHWDAGLAHADIAARLGVSRASVGSKVAREGWKRALETRQDACARGSRSALGVANGAYWSASDDEAVRQGAAKGWQCAEVGKALGRSAAAVANRARVLGVKLAQRHEARNTHPRDVRYVDAERRAPLEAVDIGPTPIPPTAKPFLDRRRDECAWPVGRDGALSCCAPVAFGSAYCGDHRARASLGRAAMSEAEQMKTFRRYAR